MGEVYPKGNSQALSDQCLPMLERKHGTLEEKLSALVLE